MNSPISREELDAKLAVIGGVSDERWHLMLQITSEIRESVRKLHLTVILTGVSVVIGVAGVNSSLLSGMVGAFESGQGMGKQAATFTQRMDKFDNRMESFEAQAAARDEGLRKELAARDAGLRAEMAKRDSELRAEMTRLRAETAQRDAKLRADAAQRDAKWRAEAAQRDAKWRADMETQQLELRALRKTVDQIAARLAQEH